MESVGGEIILIIQDTDERGLDSVATLHGVLHSNCHWGEIPSELNGSWQNIDFAFCSPKCGQSDTQERCFPVSGVCWAEPPSPVGMQAVG